MSEDEDCEQCKLAAAISVANAICKELRESQVDCEAVLQDVLQSRITVDDYLRKVYAATRSRADLREQMDEVFSFLEGG